MSGASRSFRAVVVAVRCLALVLAATLALPPLPSHSVSSASTRVDWGVKAPMPTARSGLAVAAASNGKLYAVGGIAVSACGGAGYCATVEEYDPATNTWSTKASIQARANLAMAALPNGKLYAVGGTNGGSLSTVQEYDSGSNVWNLQAPMPTAREELGVAAAPNGKLYAIGGRSAACPASTCSTVEEYDPVSNTWRGAAHGLTPMPTPRHGLGLVAGPNGKLYAIGGAGPACPGGAQCSTVEEYDPAGNIWTVKTSMPTPRVTLGVAAAPNGRLYAIGGFRNGGGGCPSGLDCALVEEYNPATNQWRGLVDGLALMPTNRSILGVATAPNGRVYAIGGFNSVGVHSEVEEYDPSANSWSVKPSLAPLPNPPAVPRNAAASAVAGGRVFVFGGANGAGTPLADSYEYNPGNNSWRAVDPMPTARYGASAVTAPNGKMYVVGGVDTGGSQLALAEEFTPPLNGAGIGSWRVAPQVAQPTAHRYLLGFALASNGRLYAVGGFGTPAGGLGVSPLGTVEELNPVEDPFTHVTGVWRDVTSMNVPRYALGVAAAGDGTLYAIGGDNGGGSVTTVERFTLPAGSFGLGSWAGPGGISPLPAPRAYLDAIGTPNGNLYAVGGFTPSGDPDQREHGEVFEYDHLANAWAIRASMPTARHGMSFGLVGSQLFAVAGYDGTSALATNEVAVLDNLPTSVSAGGPYTGGGGTAIQLNSSGTDPDSEAVSFAWDMDGDLLYETSGQNPVAIVPRKPNGTYPLRVRAMDPKGAYRIAETSITIFCSPRPPVSVQTVKIGPGQARTTITAGTGQVGLLRLGQPRPLQNAIVDVQGGPQNVIAAQDVTVNAGQVTFTVSRQGAPGTPVTVPFQVIDGCTPGLPWSSFVGFGAGV